MYIRSMACRYRDAGAAFGLVWVGERGGGQLSDCASKDWDLQGAHRLIKRNKESCRRVSWPRLEFPKPLPRGGGKNKGGEPCMACLGALRLRSTSRVSKHDD